jgi:flavin-dependent thymidylate synthase
MTVKLAGFNIDYELIEKIINNSLSEEEKEALTPEVISAAYARISRDPRDIGELRKDAREQVKNARKSNANIYYGMGHQSIAEHVNFNLDITEVSRLVLEDIEETRIGAGYTEKSQRFQRLGNNYFLPEGELSPFDKIKFQGLVEYQNKTYEEIYPVLFNHFRKKHPTKKKIDVENLAKEDARYVTSLAMKGQVGMTINARALQRKICKFNYDMKKETRQLAKDMLNQVFYIAPSLFVYCTEEKFQEYWNEKADEIKEKDPEAASKLRSMRYENSNDQNTRRHLEILVDEVIKKESKKPRINLENPHVLGNVSLIDYDSAGEVKILASLIHQQSKRDYDECLLIAQGLESEGKSKDIIKDSVRYVQKYDSIPEFFESVSLTYEIKLSASAFAQLKRHRLLTLLKQPYDIGLPNAIPESFIETGIKSKFDEVVEKTNGVYREFEKYYGKELASYVLTQSHNRRVYLKLNLREFASLSRLREDPSAQWDIRQNVVNNMSSLARIVYPSFSDSLIFGGRNTFDNIKSDIYG